MAWRAFFTKSTVSVKPVAMEKTLSGKKVAMVIAFRDFRDEEYFLPKQILQDQGAEVFTASNSTGKAVGKLGGDIEVDLLLKDLKPTDYDAVLFVGGPGAYDYFEDSDCHRIAKETADSGKILGAICIAPAILAKAGVLRGKKATVWSSALDKSAVKILEDSGAVFQQEKVVVDGKIATASGPEAAEQFGQTIANLLK